MVYPRGADTRVGAFLLRATPADWKAFALSGEKRRAKWGSHSWLQPPFRRLFRTPCRPTLPADGDGPKPPKGGCSQEWLPHL
jgi:hypothetical protein